MGFVLPKPTRGFICVRWQNHLFHFITCTRHPEATSKFKQQSNLAKLNKEGKPYCWFDYGLSKSFSFKSLIT